MAHPQSTGALGSGLDATLPPGAFDWSLAPELVLPLAAGTVELPLPPDAR